MPKSVTPSARQQVHGSQQKRPTVTIERILTRSKIHKWKIRGDSDLERWSSLVTAERILTRTELWKEKIQRGSDLERCPCPITAPSSISFLPPSRRQGTRGCHRLLPVHSGAIWQRPADIILPFPLQCFLHGLVHTEFACSCCRWHQSHTTCNKCHSRTGPTYHTDSTQLL